MLEFKTSRKPSSERFKSQDPSDRLSWENWIFDCWEDTRGEREDLAGSWKEHREIHADRIPQIEQTSLKILTDWLESGDASFEVCKLGAESIICEHMENLENGHHGVRNSRIIEEAKAIKNAAIELECALLTASESTLENVSIGFFPVRRAQMNRSSYGEEVEFRFYEQIFDEGEGEYYSKMRANPYFISMLKVLSASAKFVENNTPIDQGGAVSGSYDRDGVGAKTKICLTARNVLGNLGLKNGCQKGGPVSEFARLVHKAATGQDAPWADKYAAKVPLIEKKKSLRPSVPLKI